jgi:hypothetical protein
MCWYKNRTITLGMFLHGIHIPLSSHRTDVRNRIGPTYKKIKIKTINMFAPTSGAEKVKASSIMDRVLAHYYTTLYSYFV